MILAGALIVVVTFVLIIKKYETRLVLFVSGLIMAACSGTPLDSIAAFSKAMVNNTVVTVTCTVMGFVFVLKYTRCDEHLVQLATRPLRKIPLFSFPARWLSRSSSMWP